MSSNAPMDIDAAFAAPVQAGFKPRWERKEEAAAAAAAAASTPSSVRSVSLTAPRTGGRRRTPSGGCRFIPNRPATSENGGAENVQPGGAADAQDDKFRCKLAETLFSAGSLTTKVLAFKNKAPKPSEAHQNELRVLFSANQLQSQVKRTLRHVPSAPERVLDAPDIVDDYYLNLLDWSSAQSGRDALAVALGQSLYLWNGATGDISVLVDLAEQGADEAAGAHFTSVKWAGNGMLALGTSASEVQIWDVERQKQVRRLRGHQARVGSLAWNQAVLSSGSRDTTIVNWDVRLPQARIATLRGHEQEVCGLEWSLDGQQLASGGNDNRCCIWDAAATMSGDACTPKFTLTHSQAAVKALAWCPFQRNLLATGGGTADRHIRFYNTSTGALQSDVDTHSQVCSLVWSRHEKELVSGHGFSQNQLTVWRYPSMVKVAELTGHQARVLQVCPSPDGTTVASVSADETLRFWRVWEPRKRVAAEKPAAGAAVSLARSIR